MIDRCYQEENECSILLTLYFQPKFPDFLAEWYIILLWFLTVNFLSLPLPEAGISSRGMEVINTVDLHVLSYSYSFVDSHIFDLMTKQILSQPFI